MRSLVKLSTLFVSILLSQAISMAPSFAQSAKAHVGTAAMAIISGTPGSTVAAELDSATANCVPPSPTCILVNVPQVVPWGAQTDNNGRIQITSLTVTLNFSDISDTNPVTLTVTSPDHFDDSSQQSWNVTLTPGMLADPSCPGDPKVAVKCHDFPVPSNLRDSCPSCHDSISIVQRFSATFEVRLVLWSDYNIGGKDTTFCASTQSQNPKQYQIVSSQAVMGVCLESYSKKDLFRCASNTENKLPQEDGATFEAGSTPRSCGQ